MLAPLALAVAPVRGTTDGQVAMIVATVDDEQAQRLEAAVREAATAVHLQVVLTRVARIDVADVLVVSPPQGRTPDPPTPVARLWIDAAVGSPASLYLTDGARRRVYVRHVPLERGLLDRVALESIALVVGSSLEALVAGRELGVSREDFARSVLVALASPGTRAGGETRSVPQRSSMVRSSLRDAAITVRYELGRAVPLPYQQRIVVEYGSCWRRFRAGAGVFVAAPQAIERVPVGARLSTAGALLSMGAHWGPTSSVRLTAGAGVGIEGVRVEPNVSTAALRASPPFWSGALSLRTFGLVERTLAPLSDRWIAGLVIGVEVRPSPERYIIGDGQGDQVLFQGPRWRPFAGVLIGVRI